MAEIVFVSPASMISMTMRNHGIIHGKPWVQIKFPRNAVDSLFGKFDELQKIDFLNMVNLRENWHFYLNENWNEGIVASKKQHLLF